MAPIETYSISVSEDKIDLLHKKLALATFPDELDSAGWSYGAPLSDIKRLTRYWRISYDWRAQESKLNKELPQYMTTINVDGFGSLKIHFVHQKSTVQNAVPLLFCHGWPGSFLEVSKILPELVKGSSHYPAFHVVAPSLPNYAFSEGVKKRGFGPRQYAEVCHRLMLELGYSQYGTSVTFLSPPDGGRTIKFVEDEQTITLTLKTICVTQGGDWGFLITRTIGLLYPKHCLASHFNMFTPNHPSFRSQPLLAARYWTTPWNMAERAGLDRAKWFQSEGNGYLKEQSTKPQTIGYSQADSPVGLLAWIYEKLHDWTDGYPWTDDEVLTWVSIYWFSTAGPAASSRIYYEVVHDKLKTSNAAKSWIPDVKLGVASFPKEIAPLPRLWAKTMGEVVFESEYETGGHFAAWERPDAIVGDLRKMFGRKGGAFRVVKGAIGYEESMIETARL